MRNPRPHLKRSLRFEVLKRDKFTCQYCGRRAPEIVVHIDHIQPLSKGGGNDIINLVTSCDDCNLGKGSKELSDDSAIEKARTQLDEIQARQEQLEMLAQWHNQLRDAQDDSIDTAAAYWRRITEGFSLTGSGKAKVRKLIREFSLNEVYESMGIAADQYLERDQEDRVTRDSVEKAFGKIGGICYVRKQCRENPQLSDLRYIRGILRNRVYVNEGYVVDLLEDAFNAGVSADRLKGLAKSCSSWTDFRENVEWLTRSAP